MFGFTGIAHIVDLLIGLATVLQVKDTGKSRERVKAVELLPQEKISQSLTSTIPPRHGLRLRLQGQHGHDQGHRAEVIRTGGIVSRDVVANGRGLEVIRPRSEVTVRWVAADRADIVGSREHQ